jgi:hypothetical protein
MFHSKYAGFVLTVGVAGLGLPSVAQRRTEKTLRVKPITATTKAQRRWADRTLKKLKLEEKIGQIIEVRGIMGYYNPMIPSSTS